ARRCCGGRSCRRWPAWPGWVSPGGTVVAFSHGGAIRVAAAAALRVPTPGHTSFAPPVNTSLTVITYAGEQGHHCLVEYNSPTARAASATRAD
ncbi:histidine phosphatase family protein, partial [Micromonospora zhanjiangensis]